MGTPAVPFPHDVIIDSVGYVFADSEEQKAVFALSPIYVTRQNTQGDYGDNQQDFWLTWTQKDWTKGEQQRYQGRDDDGKSRYWLGAKVDVTVPGQVSQRKGLTSVTLAANPVSAVGTSSANLVYVSTSTTLYHTAQDGTVTSDGAHGLGAAPSRWGVTVAGGGVDVFLSTTTAGTVGVRRWNGAAYATFSATGADSIAFLNNALYGFSKTTGALNRYDSAGVATALFTWKNAENVALTGIESKLIPFGGKLLILRYRGSGQRSNAELWQYDGTNTSLLTEFPPNFKAYDIEILSGTVFVSGALEKYVSATLYQRPTIYFYKDGQQDILWQSVGFSTTASNPMLSALAVFQHGLIWLDRSSLGTPTVVFYDPTTGGVSRIAAQSVTTDSILVSSGTFFQIAGTGGTTAPVYPSAAAIASSSASSSLIDFDTSLRKQFRGVRVEFESASDGDGGTVDIKYRYDNFDFDTAPTYTTLQTGAASGAEYLLPSNSVGVSNHSMSVQVQLNKGTSTDGPVLKRIQVRAIPVQPAFKRRQYVVLLSGRDGESHVQLRDGSYCAQDGKELATTLQSSAGKPVQFSITDHLGTFTGIIEDLKMTEYKPEQWIAAVTCREV